MLSKLRKDKLEQNIWKFYLYRIFSSLIFTIPVFVLFYQSNSLSLIQIMILQSIYTAIVMILVVPAGILADYIGRKKVFITNAVFFAAAFYIFASSYTFTGFLIGEIIVAIASACWMASGSALFYDTLRELGKESSFKRLYGNVMTINYITWGTASLIGAYIATYGLRLNYWATAIVTTIALLISLSFKDTKRYKHGNKHYLLHLKDAASYTVKHPRLRLFILYSAIIWAVDIVGDIFYQPYFVAIGIPLVYFGIIYFTMSLLAAAGSKISHRIEQRLGERNILAFVLVVMIFCFLGMSRQFNIIGFIFPLIFAFALGIMDITIIDYVQNNIESHHRSTVLSLNTLVTQSFMTISLPFFGFFADKWSISKGFSLVTVVLIINLFILLRVFRMIRRRENGTR